LDLPLKIILYELSAPLYTTRNKNQEIGKIQYICINY